MDKNSVAEALRALAGSEGRSETARLRDVLPEVEAALSAGVSRTAILHTLHEQGFTMTEKSFASALHRLRKQQRAGQLQAPKVEPVHVANETQLPAALPQVLTPKEEVSPPPATGGKLRSEALLEAPNKSYSFKKLQKAKDQK